MLFACRHLLTALITITAVALGGGASTAAADTGDPLAYYGGPVIHSATGVVVNWGSQVNPIYTNATTGDPGLIASFAAASGTTSNTGAVLAQYMDTTGHNSANAVRYAGQYTITPTVTASTLQDSQVGAQLVAQITAGQLPTPAGDGLSTIYLVNFPAGVTICSSEGCSGQSLCAFHSSATMPDGTRVVYVVLPDNTTGAMTDGCGTEPTPLRDQTSYASHEWSEAINDPLVNLATNAGPPLAWYDAGCPAADSACGEIGDKCNQDTTVQAGFTVQLEWSNLDAGCAAGESRFAAPVVSLAPLSKAARVGQVISASGSAVDPPGNTTSASYNGSTYTVHPGIAGYSWSWGDGATATGVTSASHTYATPGLYTVTLTATDNLGFAGTATATVGAWGPLGAPAAVTGGASSLTPSGATLAATVSPAGLTVGSRFDYGLAAAALTGSTPVVPVAAGKAGRTVSTSLTGLAPGTTYYYRADVVIAGQALPGAVQSFTTPGLAGASQHPTVTTGAVARLTASTAQLTGTVDPAGPGAVVYRFVYGHGARLAGASSAHAVSGSGQHPVVEVLRGLKPHTTYRYRVIATLDGHTIAGAWRSFRTPAAGALIARRALQTGRTASAAVATVLGDASVAGALRHGIRVRVGCAGRCTTRVIVTLRLGSAATPRALATQVVSLPAGGSRVAGLRLAARDRGWLTRLGGAASLAAAAAS